MTADQILQKHEDANEMHFHQVDREWIIQAMKEYATSSQTEILDEEIIKAAFEHCVEIYQKVIDYENYDTYNDFIIGAKWYREQLKSRR